MPVSQTDTAGLMEHWAEHLVEQDIQHLIRHNQAAKTSQAALQSGRYAIWIAFFAGLVCSGALGMAEIAYFTNGADQRDLLLFIAATILLTLLEFWLLFRCGFRAAAQMIVSSADELALQNRGELVRALCRAVLEIPEPDIRPFNLNPAKYVRRERKLLLLVLYRVKIMASNFIAKQLLKRLLARAGLRSYAPLVAGPITGLWNAWVMALVLQEARYRIMNRLAADCILSQLDRQAPSPQLQQALAMLIACRITLFGVYNQSLDYLLDRLFASASETLEMIAVLDDTDTLLQAYAELPPDEQDWLRATAALLFAGKRSKLTAQEQQLLQKLGVYSAQIDNWRQRFTRLDVKAVMPDRGKQ